MDTSKHDAVAFDGFLSKVRNLSWLLDPVEMAKYKSQLVQRGWHKGGPRVRWEPDPFSLAFGFLLGSATSLLVVYMLRPQQI
jgi:hypothetical protein